MDKNQEKTAKTSTGLRKSVRKRGQDEVKIFYEHTIGKSTKYEININFIWSIEAKRLNYLRASPRFKSKLTIIVSWIKENKIIHMAH